LPYNREIVPHLLRLTDENYDKNGAQRQLSGLSIAAKRYALYTTKCGQPFCSHRVCVTIVDPKAHGLIFFAPGEEREKGLPKWWWELWRFLLALEFKEIIEPNCGFLLIGGRAIDSKTTADVDGQPSWIVLPAMMKMRISTPHYLDQNEGQSQPVRIRPTSSNARQAETHAAHPIQQKPSKMGALPMHQHVRWKSLLPRRAVTR
jgi:hypothetical protein